MERWDGDVKGKSKRKRRRRRRRRCSDKGEHSACGEAEVLTCCNIKILLFQMTYSPVQTHFILHILWCVLRHWDWPHRITPCYTALHRVTPRYTDLADAPVEALSKVTVLILCASPSDCSRWNFCLEGFPDSLSWTPVQIYNVYLPKCVGEMMHRTVLQFSYMKTVCTVYCHCV